MYEPNLPTISVVVPTLNEAGTVARCIRSVLGPHVHDLIVVDGGSSDRTRSIAAGAGAAVLEAPCGRARQMNTGARSSTGDILLFLHADCTLARGAIPRLRRTLVKRRPIVGYYNQRIDGAHALYRLIEFGSNLRARWLKRPYGDQAMFFDRSTFQRLGGFPDVPIMEDLLMARAARRYGPLLAMPEVVTSSARRWQHDGILRRILRNWWVAIGEYRGDSLPHLQRRYEASETQQTDAPALLMPASPRELRRPAGETGIPPGREVTASGSA